MRYWPDLHGTKEFGKVLVRNVDERPAQDYVLRKLEVTRLDRVGKAAATLTSGQHCLLSLSHTHTHAHTLIPEMWNHGI